VAEQEQMTGTGTTAPEPTMPSTLAPTESTQPTLAPTEIPTEEPVVEPTMAPTDAGPWTVPEGTLPVFEPDEPTPTEVILT